MRPVISLILALILASSTVMASQTKTSPKACPPIKEAVDCVVSKVAYDFSEIQRDLWKYEAGSLEAVLFLARTARHYFEACGYDMPATVESILKGLDIPEYVERAKESGLLNMVAPVLTGLGTDYGREIMLREGIVSREAVAFARTKDMEAYREARVRMKQAKKRKMTGGGI